MAENKRRGRFGKGSQDDASQSIFDLFEPPPEQESSSFGKIPIIRDDDDSLDLTDVEYVEAQAAAEAEAAGLAHWAEPATGQVPAALAVDRADAAEVKGPSWRGEDPNWAGPDLSDVFADTEAITHDRLIDVDDDDLSVDPTPTPPPRRRAKPAAEQAPPRRPQPEAPSVFDRPPGSRPVDAPAPPAPTGGDPFGGRTRRRSGPDPAPGRDSTPRPAARPQPAPPPAAAPATAGLPATTPPAPGPAVRRASAAVPPPARAGTNAAGPARDPATSAFTPPPAAADPGELPRRRGAHDLPPSGVSLDPSVLDPGAPGPRSPRPAGRPPIDLDEPAGVLDADPDDYDEYYDDYDDYDDSGGGRRLGQSFIVGIALAAVVFVTLGFGPIPTMVMIGVLTLLAVMELFNAMRVAGLRPATLLGLVGAVALPAATYVRGDAGYPLVVGLAVVFGMLWYLTGADTERPVLNLGLTLTGVMWIGGLAGFGALMLKAEDGVGLLLATIIITATSDTFAYLGGRAYGTKSFHSASPNKTWEGTLTGFFGALFAGLAIGVTDLISVFNSEFVSVMVLAAVVGVLAPIGDLAESLVKRDLGIKDMGTLLPGHGGVLDRVDGLLFALPGAYYVAVVYQLI
ncbi:MAG: phosphatidate cytidylyltransferase [Acidimicrobiia bacterium]|nr:phosphatidate cytidylyltransferase [Acidimicrobiia bacterium]